MFHKPKCLPPSRSQDYRTPLLPGTSPINARPYRYTFGQKDEIERQIQEIPKSSIIQSSVSHYALLVLLVRKKDNGWRFCMDYRKLNKTTVKNKYPIPMIDNLLDEFEGSQY